MTSSAHATAAVRARGLGRRFGRRWALAHLDLEIRRGEALLLAGPNGSGKTTLVRLMAGLLKPTSGRLEVFGLDPGAERLACRRRLALVSHHSYLYERLTAFEMVQVWARLLGRRSARHDLAPLLAEVGLEDRMDSLVGGFSAGMRRRLALLRCRLESPELVLLDEPFAALDPSGQRLVEEWIGALRGAGRTVVLVSHDLARGGRLCERAMVLREGQLAWQGPAGEAAGLLEEP